ncbi:DNA helicase UvrD [Candidatus Parcubacteria bacterium]|nr:DNA helicase UvrD [Candidatus Parcubacteria bacterium]
MRFIGDFHLHSKYSRATSKNMDLEHMDEWAKIKGIEVLTAADFTHPEWFAELREKLEPAEQGLYRLNGSETRFILTTEISCIYSKGGKVRKIHIVIFAPSFEVVKKINGQLAKIGNLKADGRPILGLDAKELAKIALDVSEDCLIVPAHIYTPWFSLFGSRSGFDSIEECFENYTKYIFAGETGLSSDPPMSWRNSNLDKMTLISNSDAHSLPKIGREANIFEGEMNYKSIVSAIKREPGKTKLVSTIEFYPEEGKYHYDGHRDCDICLTPQESKKYNNICPVCGRSLVIGVLNRIEDLADRKKGFKPKGAIPFKSLVPLSEIIAESLGLGVNTKGVNKEYQNLIKNLGSEFKILLEIPLGELKNFTLPEIAEAIIRVREGKVRIEPGYDGVFGKIKIFSEAEREKHIKQKALF